ncbi:hypothetical protein H4K33_15960, partial [Myroides sp. WP-1]|nr:hypothetical protein [Myroides sp. WP-1]
MKKKLVSIAVLLFASVTYAQVGIGTTQPHKSAELTVLSKDKGVLIPNITLTSTTDATTIANGNVESLLVYANKAQGDIVPGFYYWDKTRWVRLISNVDVADEVIKNFSKIISDESLRNQLEQFFNLSGGNVFYDGTTLTYKDATGTVREISIAAIVKANETVTTLVKDPSGNGKYTYRNEAGVEVVIDVSSDVIKNFERIINNTEVQEFLNQFIVDNGGNVRYDGNTFSYTNADGTTTTLDMGATVKAHETKTTLVDNQNGTYTYTSENGTQTIINVPQSVVEQFETIIANEVVKEQIEEIIKNVGGNVFYDGTKFEYTDGSGVKQLIDVAAIVKANETVTSLDYDSTTGVLTYQDEEGEASTVDLKAAVKAHETKTTLVDNQNGTYTYTSENGTQTIINVPQSVVEQFETIIANEVVKEQIEEIVKNVGGNVFYDGTKFEYTDGSGV